MVPGFDLPASFTELSQRLLRLIDDSLDRSKMLKDFDEVQASLQGFAAENAAEIIGQEIGEWRLKKRGKDSKAA